MTSLEMLEKIAALERRVELDKMEIEHLAGLPDKFAAFVQKAVFHFGHAKADYQRMIANERDPAKRRCLEGQLLDCVAWRDVFRFWGGSQCKAKGGAE